MASFNALDALVTDRARQLPVPRLMTQSSKVLKPVNVQLSVEREFHLATGFLPLFY